MTIDRGISLRPYREPLLVGPNVLEASVIDAVDHDGQPLRWLPIMSGMALDPSVGTSHFAKGTKSSYRFVFASECVSLEEFAS